jgi:glutamate-1-semialdehyde 2,1-aminomutase
MVNPFFTNQKVTDFDSAQTSNTELFAKFFWAMAENGLYIPPSQFEAWFLPIVLTDEELNEIIKRIHAAFQAIK